MTLNQLHRDYRRATVVRYHDMRYRNPNAPEQVLWETALEVVKQEAKADMEIFKLIHGLA